MSGEKRIVALDGVRGFAVLTVLVFHTLPIPDAAPSLIVTLWNAAVKSCWVGVDLFFVLSGFLITRALCDAKGRPNFFRKFYIARALRIAPLYFTVLIGALYIVPLLIPADELPSLHGRLIKNQWWLWLFLQNYIQARTPHQLPGFGHFWTLAVEEQFYIIWPAIVFWISRRWLVLSSLAICIIEPLARYYCLTAGYSTWAIRQLTFLRIDALLAGALVYLLFGQTMSTPIAIASMRIVSCAAAGIALWMSFRYSFLPYQSEATVIVGYSAVAALCASLIRACLSNGVAARFLSCRFLRWFGKYSYAIYIFSVPAILCFQPLIGDRISVRNPFVLPVSRLLFSGVVSVACAFISWKVIEHPALSLKSRFTAPNPIRPLSPALATAE